MFARLDRNSLVHTDARDTFFFPALKFSVDAAAPLYSQEITALRVKVKEPRSEEECESIFQVDISQKQQQEKKKKSCSEDKANKAGGCNHLETNKKKGEEKRKVWCRVAESSNTEVTQPSLT